MGETSVLEHIRSWQSAGLIDAPTADRLRAAEAAETADGVGALDEVARAPAGAQESRLFEPEPMPGAPSRPILVPAASTVRSDDVAGGGQMAPVRIGTLTGDISVVDVLTCLGVGLLVAAWYWELSSHAPALGTVRSAWFAAGTAIPTVLATVAALALRGRVDRRGRAVGPLMLAAGLQVAFVGYFLADLALPGGAGVDLTAGALLWAVVAIAFRRLQASASTCAGVVVAVIAAGGFAEGWLRSVVFGEADWTGETVGGLVAPGPLIPILGAGWWLAVAAALAFVAVGEEDAADEAGARRAGIVRVVAGVVAVLGVGGSLLGTGWPTATGFIDRLEPVIGDAALLALAVALVALASSTRVDAWLYPAALGIVIALSDLNVQYLADGLGIGVALLLEGAILVAVAAATEATRRRLAGSAGARAPAS